MSLLRIFIDLCMCVAVFFAPWWLFCILVPILVFYFASYYEILFFAVIFDALYGVADHWWGIPFLLYASLVFLVSLYLKKRLSFYS